MATETVGPYTITSHWSRAEGGVWVITEDGKRIESGTVDAAEDDEATSAAALARGIARAKELREAS